MEHVLCGVPAVAARVVFLVGVSVAYVDGAVDKLAPLLFFGRIGKVRAEGSENQTKAHYVRNALPPGFDTVGELGSEALCGEKVGEIVNCQV